MQAHTSPARFSSREEARLTLLSSISVNLGSHVMEALQNPEVIEIMLNPDGRLWIEQFGRPMTQIATVTPEQADLAITLIASAMNAAATRDSPIIEGELPLDGSRFEGLIPPPRWWPRLLSLSEKRRPRFSHLTITWPPAI